MRQEPSFEPENTFGSDAHLRHACGPSGRRRKSGSTRSSIPILREMPGGGTTQSGHDCGTVSGLPRLTKPEPSEYGSPDRNRRPHSGGDEDPGEKKNPSGVSNHRDGGPDHPDVSRDAPLQAYQAPDSGCKGQGVVALHFDGTRGTWAGTSGHHDGRVDPHRRITVRERAAGTAHHRGTSGMDDGGVCPPCTVTTRRRGPSRPRDPMECRRRVPTGS